MKILIPFYSTYGHTYKMVEAVVEVVEKIEGSRQFCVELKRPFQRID
ncbi:hypothetical protein [Halonatronum saccharophilum]|nr:hypothetical protein [Halonatronum saccharophilum]